jgi:hypothetical protein
MDIPRSPDGEASDHAHHQRRLEQAISAGTYDVDAISVADAVLKSWLMADVVDRWRALQSTGTDGGSDDSSS